MSTEKEEEFRIRETDLRDAVFLLYPSHKPSYQRSERCCCFIYSMVDSSIFSGCNIKISFGRAFHAENVILLKAIPGGIYKYQSCCGYKRFTDKTKSACVSVADKTICI